MRLLVTSALALALFGPAIGAAFALEVEILAPVASEARPETPLSPPSPTAAVETGSIEAPAQEGETPVTAAPVTEPAPPAPGIARLVRDMIEAEIAAIPPPAPVAEGQPKPQKSPEQRDREALQAFYEARNDAPVWVGEHGLTAKARAAIAEIQRADDWGLVASEFVVPRMKGDGETGPDPSRDDLAKAEMAVSLAVMQYHRHARGGRIADPAKQLSSYLDRRPRLRDRKTFLEDLARTDDPAAYLVGLHPQQPEFKRLLDAWRIARGKSGQNAKPMRGSKGNADQLLANMQQWRWMPEDLGEYYVWVNVPEYTIRIVRNGEVLFTERITAGLVNKQTPIFSDEIERVTFKSRWRVPDSIKVREVWPSLLRGGGMMRQHGLIMMRGEEEIDWRKIDWSKANMQDYTLWQPPGPKNQLGLVKFSFPNKHYVFMHDTPDKYMFAWNRRANSHGCMRIRNPLQMATLILDRDKGWNRSHIDDLVTSGPDHNVIELDKKIPVHITYFTARIDETGKMQTWPDVYGHEKRVRQALGGQWDRIAKSADHLAPLDQTRIPRVVASTARKTNAFKPAPSILDLMFGGLN
ncbi:MAG: L,D-transpeptidase family protein [Hyphomicrobium sp.]